MSPTRGSAVGVAAMYDATSLQRRASRAPRPVNVQDHISRRGDVGGVVVTNRMPPKLGDLIGRRVGGYVIEALLGEGGMGAVYVATNPRLERKAAVKVIAREYTRDAELVERFFREARAVAAVDDPNIIEIYDADRFTEDSATFISMRLIEGRSLAAMCEAMGPMPLDIAGAIALQIASGLDAVHSVSIVHRDIKPQNILISRRWRRRYFATIVDFGIAKLLDPQLAAGFRTKTKLVVGTLGYMAPEQARADRDVDRRADIYSLGVVMYQMLTGRRPYTEESLYGLIEQQVHNAPFPRPRELRPDIPPVIDEAIMSALQIARDSRPSSMRELARRLAEGLPNGDVLLRALAPRCTEMQSSPDASTLSGDLEEMVPRWSAARSAPAGRSRRAWLPAVLAAALGIPVGSVATLVVGSQSETADVTAPAERHVSPAEAVTAPNAGLAPGPAPARDAPTAPPPQAAAKVPPPSGGSAAEPIARNAEPRTPALVAEPGGRKLPGLELPMSLPPPSEQPKPAKPAKPRPPAAAHGKHELVVRVKTWAEVWVDKVRVGTAPLRVPISAGRHEVRLVHETLADTVQADVGATREFIITRDW